VAGKHGVADLLVKGQSACDVRLVMLKGDKRVMWALLDVWKAFRPRCFAEAVVILAFCNAFVWAEARSTSSYEPGQPRSFSGMKLVDEAVRGAFVSEAVCMMRDLGRIYSRRVLWAKHGSTRNHSQ